MPDVNKCAPTCQCMVISVSEQLCLWIHVTLCSHESLPVYPCEAQSPVPLWQLVLQEAVGVGARVLRLPPSPTHLLRTPAITGLSGGGEYPASRISSLCCTQTPASAHSWAQRHQTGSRATKEKEVEVTLQLLWTLTH